MHAKTTLFLTLVLLTSCSTFTPDNRNQYRRGAIKFASVREIHDCKSVGIIDVYTAMQNTLFDDMQETAKRQAYERGATHIVLRSVNSQGLPAGVTGPVMRAEGFNCATK